MNEHKRLFCSLFTKGLLKTKNFGHEYSESLIKVFILSNRFINFPMMASLLDKVSIKEINPLIQLSFFIRNPRGGKGAREIGRFIYQWLLINYPEEFVKHILKIHEFGRWDDIYLLFPGSLRLSTLDFTNKNYCSNITKKTFKKVKIAQKTIVEYVSKVFLESFHDFMDGKKGFELFVKWLPLENSSFNKKYKIVETLCDELNISLKDYRIIYLTPMRKVSDICETYMCKKDWMYINYNKLNKKRIGYYKNAFKRHDNVRFSKWSKENPQLYIKKPSKIIDTYFDKILDNDMKIENSSLESSWQQTIKLILDNTTTNLLVVLDTNGYMYKKIENIRIFSYALSLSIISSCQRKYKKHKVILYKNNEGFLENSLTPSLKDVINMYRLTFTSQPTIKELVEYSKNNTLETFLYITYKEYTIDKKDIIEDDKNNENIKRPKIIIWNITSTEISYKKINSKIFILSGFTLEIYRYFLIFGDFSPNNILNEIISTYSI